MTRSALQVAFFRRCQTTEVHFMVCVARGALIRIHGDANGRLGLPCKLCQSGLPTDGTVLPFVFKRLF